MLDWIYDTPLGSLAGLTAIVFVGAAWLGTILLRPILRGFVRSRGAGEIVTNVLSNFGVLYGILLGLTAVAAYQNWSQVNANVTKEASAVLNLYQEVGTYPAPHGQNLRWLLREIVRYEIKYEWPLLKEGVTFTEDAAARIEAFQERLLAFEPQTKTEELVHAEAIRQFNSFMEQRRLRIYSASISIPPALWYVVIAGAIINMLLVWQIDTNLLNQLFLGGLLAFFLGAMILLIAILDKPFKSRAGISPAALELVHKVMMRE